MQAKNKKFKHAGIGGTFDRLHKGHKELISFALGIAENVTIGVTIDGFSSQKKLSQSILSYGERVEEIKKFIKSLGKKDSVSIVSLKDSYGPTIENNDIDCVVVTDQTHEGALKINNKRKELNLLELPIKKANLILDNENKYISSTRIRLGIINRNGQLYRPVLDELIVFTDSQKKTLKDPQGKIFQKSEVEKIKENIKEQNPPHVSVVGDISGSVFIKNNIRFNTIFYDGKTKRKPSSKLVELIANQDIVSFTNNPGTINPEITSLYKKIKDNSGSLVYVEGEEDLIALALTLLLPLNSQIYYGQPEDGLVCIEVSEENKEKFYSLIKNN
ncbi:pantetheine-phosphate adenylyltransferase [Patescibacteria group bacterium]